MIRLLKANFSRLWQNNIFRLAFMASIIAGVLCPLFGRHIQRTSGEYAEFFDYINYIDFYLWKWTHVISLALTIFCGFFIGTEYRDGTLRNKIAAGHSRTAIYLTNLITNAVAGCIFYSVYLIANFCVGMLVLGWFQVLGPGEIAALILCGYVVLLAVAAIVTMAGLLSSSQAGAAIACIAVVLVFLFVGTFHISSLTEVFMANMMGNRGVEISKFFLDFLPGSQMMELMVSYTQIGNLNTHVMLGGSAVFFCGATAIGLLKFGRKELK